MTQHEKDKLEKLFLAFGNARWNEGAALMEPRQFSNFCYGKNHLAESTKIYGKFLEMMGKVK